MNEVKLALSMRRSIVNYGSGKTEERDAISADWGQFLCLMSSKVTWFPLPNLGSQSVELAQNWGINRIILTGGESLGDFAIRDQTEFKLLTWAAEHRLPVLGVCRGAQVVNAFCGGGKLCEVTGHVATRHKVVDVAGNVRIVNSYHSLAIQIDALPENLVGTEFTEDGRFVEGFSHKHLPWHGVMWHPEREQIPSNEDIFMVKNFLRGTNEI